MPVLGCSGSVFFPDTVDEWLYRCCWILCLITYWRLSAWLESECKPDHKFVKFGDCSINVETAQIPKGCVSEYAVPLNASQGLKPYFNHKAIAICIHMCHSVKTWPVFPYWGNGHQSILVLLYILVGGFKHFFFILTISYMGCHPSHWLSYFSRWLKPPTTIYKDLHSQDVVIPMAWDDLFDHIFQCLRSPHKHPHCMVPKHYGDV